MLDRHFAQRFQIVRREDEPERIVWVANPNQTRAWRDQFADAIEIESAGALINSTQDRHATRRFGGSTEKKIDRVENDRLVARLQSKASDHKHGRSGRVGGNDEIFV